MKSVFAVVSTLIVSKSCFGKDFFVIILAALTFHSREAKSNPCKKKPKNNKAGSFGALFMYEGPPERIY